MFLILALLVLLAAVAVRLFLGWERGAVEPFFELAAGFPSDEVVDLVGKPAFQFESNVALDKAADDWGLLCEEIHRVQEKSPLPDDYQRPEPPNRFWDSILT